MELAARMVVSAQAPFDQILTLGLVRVGRVGLGALPGCTLWGRARVLIGLVPRVPCPPVFALHLGWVQGTLFSSA